MKEYFDCLITTHGIAFAAGTAIFLLTVLLVAKRFIGFTFSVIMLLFALATAWAINNDKWLRQQVDQWMQGTQVTTTETTTTSVTESVPSPSDAASMNALTSPDVDSSSLALQEAENAPSVPKEEL